MKGKYNSERDKILDFMSETGWANDCTGSAEYGGWFHLIINQESDRAGLLDAFGEDMAACEPPVTFEDLIGNFIVCETIEGIVTVVPHDSEFEAWRVLRQWKRTYQNWEALQNA